MITDFQMHHCCASTSTPSLLFCSKIPPLRTLFKFYIKKAPPLPTYCASITTNSPNSNYIKKPNEEEEEGASSTWLTKWPSLDEKRTVQPRRPIERIVERLRNLGSDDKEEETQLPWEKKEGEEGDLGEKELGYLLTRKWDRPDRIGADSVEIALPWEKGEEEVSVGEELRKKERRVIKAPSLAELTLPDEELRRLRKVGMLLRERVSIPKAGLTKEVLEKIHKQWRKNELVRLKFHEVLARDMKTAHEIVERRTDGLVTWRSGSVMVVYRGTNYGGPPKLRLDESESNSKEILHDGDKLYVPDVPVEKDTIDDVKDTATTSGDINPFLTDLDRVGKLTADEAEYNIILDDLGPRYVEWWGTGLLPVDADLLPQQIPGYKTPFRLLPNGMRSRLTNAEMTSLRKLTKTLPCHFALGRNRNHQGLADAIVKLWEKTTVVKIAVKRGIQNTNNKIMAEELKNLTGGLLLLRNKYYIVIYRGKDFLPRNVASALQERWEQTKHIQDIEERVRNGTVGSLQVEAETKVMAGTLDEFKKVQAQWGRDIAEEERERMIDEASKAKGSREVKKVEHKLALAHAKLQRAEKQLSKIEASMIPIGPCEDRESITDEERFMFRRVGLRMKAYLPLGIRGVFDGVIENMHLHWKHRELVKLISKQKTLEFVEDTGKLLEYESGGILVAIERVPKGYALIYYRGKNYQRPNSLRPRNLLTKAKALKRSVEIQRHEALSQHIEELERTIKGMKAELGDLDDSEDDDVENFGKQVEGEDEYFSPDEDDGFDSEDDD